MASPPLPKEDLQHVLDHTHELWGDLRGQRIFITGGTGFFGCWLLETFAFANDQLGLNARALVLTRDIEKFNAKAPHLAAHPAIKLMHGDVRTFDFPGVQCSHVIHAATTSSAIIEPLEMLDIIIGGTRRVLDFALHCGAKKFLLTSSGAVYGKQPPDLTHIPETYNGAPDPTDLNSAYGEGKRVAELLCSTYAKQHGIEAKIARCFAFVGPHLPLDAHFAIGNFIRDAMQGGPIIVQGDGTAVRSYLYAADLAIWLWTILFRGAPQRIWNVGSRNALSVAQLAGEVVRVLALQPHSIRIEEQTCSTARIRYVPDTTRAEKELALCQTINLDGAISKTAQWLKNNSV